MVKMIFETGEIIIDGFTFEKIEEKRVIQSVFILDVEDGSCVETPVLNDECIDKEKLAIKLMECFRKEVVAIIDIENDFTRTDSCYYNLWFVRIKDK